MPKYLVELGRLVREQVTLVIEAPNAEAIDVDAIYGDYNGEGWEADQFWGTEPSESHEGVVGVAPDDAEVDIVVDLDPSTAL